MTLRQFKYYLQTELDVAGIPATIVCMSSRPRRPDPAVYVYVRDDHEAACKRFLHTIYEPSWPHAIYLNDLMGRKDAIGPTGVALIEPVSESWWSRVWSLLLRGVVAWWWS